MSKRQKQTIPDKKYLVDSLEPNYQKAIFMRLDGRSHIDIMNTLDCGYTTVRNWFMKGGICHAAYQELLAEVSRERREQFNKLNEKFEEYAPDALETLHSKSKVSWKAAESLLDRAGFSPVQKIKAEVENKENDEKIEQSANKIADYVRQNLADGNQKNP